MKKIFFIKTTLSIHHLLKFAFQKGTNFLIYRNVIVKEQHGLIRTNNYVLITDDSTVSILKTFYKNGINIYGYNLQKLNFLNNINTVSLKVNAVSSENHNNAFSIQNNKIEFHVLKRLLQSYINKNICTLIHPYYFYYYFINNNNNIYIRIVFNHNASLYRKYLTYLYFKNMLITMNSTTNEDTLCYLIH